MFCPKVISCRAAQATAATVTCLVPWALASFKAPRLYAALRMREARLACNSF